MARAGTSKGTEIEIRTSETNVTTQAGTLAHEVAHSLLHFTPDGKRIRTRDGKEIDKQQRELEAEAVAYVVGSYFGIQSPSDFYLAAYRITPAMLLDAGAPDISSRLECSGMDARVTTQVTSQGPTLRKPERVVGTRPGWSSRL
jgi:hypothetical protein